jgi:hypothetical protein
MKVVDDPLDRIRWRRAIAASVLINGVFVAIFGAFDTLRNAQRIRSVPIVTRISIERVVAHERTSPQRLPAPVSAHREPSALIGGEIPVPRYEPTADARRPSAGHRVVSPAHVSEHQIAGLTSAARIGSGSSRAVGSSREIHGYDDVFRSAIERAKNAADVPMGPLVASTPTSGKLGPTFAFHLEPKLNAATWPLPERGLFAHARVVRTDVDAAAIRSTTKIGGMWFCIGYYVKIDRGNAENSLAGPYAGPCHRDWLVQLGINRAPASSESPDPVGSPAVEVPKPLASPSFGRAPSP